MGIYIKEIDSLGIYIIGVDIIASSRYSALECPVPRCIHLDLYNFWFIDLVS